MEIKYEITERIGVISRNERTNWTKEANWISWNGNDPKIDIREWDEAHEKMSKGITLTAVEAAALLEILSDLRYKNII